VQVNGVTIAKGEVVIVEDSTAIRVTEIPQPSSTER
jgi:flagellar motor switch/type III secretory pathway protein FliN